MSSGSGTRRQDDPWWATGRAGVVLFGVLAGAAAAWAAHRRRRRRPAHDAVGRRGDDTAPAASGVPAPLQHAELQGLGDDPPSMQRPRIRWIRTQFFLAAFVFIVLCSWQAALPAFSMKSASQCVRDAVALAASSEACEAMLTSLLRSVSATEASTCPTARPTSPWLWQEPGMPRALIWFDNVFVDLYTALFIAVAGASLHSRGGLRAHGLVGRSMLMLTLLLCVAGAVVDHAENFWLLAHMGTAPACHARELDGVVSLSLWKLRLFFLNAAIAAVWLARGRTRQMWSNPDF